MAYLWAMVAFMAVYTVIRAIGAWWGYDPKLGDSIVVIIAVITADSVADIVLKVM